MISREEALTLLHSQMQSQNLRKHCYAVEVTMKALAKHFNEDEELWGIVGLLHDADYEKFPTEHPKRIISDLEGLKAPEEIVNAIRAHAWGYNGMDYEPKSKLDWSIYICDELTGFIVAVTLIRPEKKLASVTVDNILSKWGKKDFAKGVERDHVELCEEKLGIKLNDFIELTLKAMQSISSELGL
jgi:putative nucleotidyltransferase with HDIG domain